MRYTLDEQETFINYDPITKLWTYETTYHGHISKIMKHKDLYDILEVEYDNGKPGYIKATTNHLSYIAPFARKRRVLSEDERQKLIHILAEARNKKA